VHILCDVSYIYIILFTNNSFTHISQYKVESLWEWFAYTKHLTDADPSWGRVWPTALSLSRFIIRSLNEKIDVVAIDKVNDEKKEAPPTREQTLMDRISSGANYKADGSTGSKGLSNTKDVEQTVTTNNEEQPLMKQAVHALQTTPHIVEVGCGLGVVGLAYAQTISSSSPSTSHSCVAMKQTGVINEQTQQRTITFLDKEPYCLQCVMSSCATNGIVTGSILPQSGEVTVNKDAGLVARAAIDDWTLPISTNADDKNSSQQIKNICYQDLNLPNNENTILLASDILYEPSTMKSLASKLQQLVHPINGGYCLIADPLKERTIGCRDEFVKSVKALGGEIDIINLPTLDKTDKDMLVEGDMDINGEMASTVLILVNFKGR